MSRHQEALDRLGELFIIGFDGTELSDDTSAFISQAGIGGVILFSKNYRDVDQICALNKSIQECKRDLPLWISVDHEGGRVQRFKAPFTIIPSARRIAKQNSPKTAFEIAEVSGRELSSVGVNLNFTPVCDIETNPSNPVLGDRAFGNTEEEVSKHVTAMMRGHLVHGVQGCAKHFPGHGDTHQDSHFDLPKVSTTLEVLRDREFKPFQKAFKSRCAFVMTAHVVYEAIEPKIPATFSKKFLREILRGEFRYTKLIISDDLEMEAITKHWGADEAPRLAIEAGCDLLIYRSEGAARKAYTALKRAIESDQLAPEIVIESANRSRDLKREVLLPSKAIDPTQAKSVIGCADHQEIVNRIGK